MHSIISRLPASWISGFWAIVKNRPYLKSILIKDLINYLDYNLLQLRSVLPTADCYDLLETEVPMRSEVIKYLDSLQTDEGTWATGQIMYVPWVAQILMFYSRSGAKPKKPLDPFFSTVDTWDKVNAHVNTYSPGNYWGGLWGYVTCYVVYKGEAPPWTDEFLEAVRTEFNSWAYNNHQRTHLMGNLYQLNQPIPRLDEVIDSTLQQQREDGSWDYNAFETALSTLFLKYVKKINPLRNFLIDDSINRGLEFIKSCYKNIYYQGKSYEGFAINPSAKYPTLPDTTEGIWVLLNPDSDVYTRWKVQS